MNSSVGLHFVKPAIAIKLFAKALNQTRVCYLEYYRDVGEVSILRVHVS